MRGLEKKHYCRAAGGTMDGFAGSAFPGSRQNSDKPEFAISGQ